MNHKTGRNDPCPCGSGRKYKHCHGQPAAPAPADDPAKAVSRALGWLHERYRKAVQATVEELIFEQFWPAENPDPEEVREDLWQMIMINVYEWLLAAGELPVKGRHVAVSELLLGPGGPPLGPRQKDFLQQLSSRPIRLYEITDSRPGDGLTLVDALADESEALIVQERAGSESLQPGDLLGARVIQIDDHLELSGAIYPFTRLYAGVLMPAAREFVKTLEEENPDEEQDREIAQFIVEHWFANITLPAPMPRMMDASTGEPLLLVTDHYQVIDRGALEAALAATPELEHTDDDHWQWLDEDEHGVCRARLSLRRVPARAKRPERVEMFCRTQRLADEGRAWLEELAGECVSYLTREITDPAGAMRAGNGPKPGTDDKGKGRLGAIPDMPPEQMNELVAEAIRLHYANWVDEPVPALGDRTPREAMATPGGLERVKGLLRSYDVSERQQAADQRREPVSFQFLWDQLGISRD